MKLLLGVSGGIAAYKSCEVVSAARKAGHEVRVVMTPNATRFVAPLTFEALCGHKVMVDTFADALDHIAWAKWAEVVLVAPASANVLGKLACGLADDALGTTLMAVPRGRPVLLAPAMNTEMWLHPVVQRNLRWLEALDRYTILAPVEKRLACGDYGPGGLPDPGELLAAAEAALQAGAPRPA